MMSTLESKHRSFQALHARPGVFVVPNPWDAGSARVLTALGSVDEGRQPKFDGSKGYEACEGEFRFVESHGDAPISFQFVDHAFDAIAMLVDKLIMRNDNFGIVWRV